MQQQIDERFAATGQKLEAAIVQEAQESVPVGASIVNTNASIDNAKTIIDNLRSIPNSLDATIKSANARIDGAGADIDKANAGIDKANARIDVTNTRYNQIVAFIKDENKNFQQSLPNVQQKRNADHDEASSRLDEIEQTLQEYQVFKVRLLKEINEKIVPSLLKLDEATLPSRGGLAEA